jgi:hypothetical protein
VKYNRYSYCLNNPLIYTDPTGEFFWIAVGIGAAIGGYSGYKTGQAHGATGGKMAGYILGGALIGGVSGGVGAGISAAGGAAWWAGAAAGAIGGAGFNGLATNWNPQAMWNGFWNGAAAGFIGGYFGSMIGGGWGTLAGGAASNLSSQLLYGNGDINWGSVVSSGAFSLGMYHAMSFGAWKWGGGNRIGTEESGYTNIKYKTYLRMNTMLQRSRAWKGERGFWILEDGSYENFKGAWWEKHGINTKNLKPPTGNAKYMVHTHWQPNEFPLDVLSHDFNGYKLANPFKPSAGDVFRTNELNVNFQTNFEGLILTNRNIIQFRGAQNYISNWDYPMLRYFPLFWWF